MRTRAKRAPRGSKFQPSIKAQIFKTSKDAEKAVLSGEVEYALESRPFPNDVYYTYVYCTKEKAGDLVKRCGEQKSDQKEFHLCERCEFTKNHPDYVELSVEYTEAEKVLAGLL